MIKNRQAKELVKQYWYDAYIDGIANGLPNDNPPLPAPNFTKRGSVDVYTPEVRWRNVESVNLIDNGEHWLRFSMQNLRTVQSTLNGGTGIGAKYTTTGIIAVELYFSRSAYESSDEDTLAAICIHPFVKSSLSGIWFRNPTIVDLPPEETYLRTNIFVDYTFDSRF